MNATPKNQRPVAPPPNPIRADSHRREPSDEEFARIAEEVLRDHGPLVDRLARR